MTHTPDSRRSLIEKRFLWLRLRFGLLFAPESRPFTVGLRWLTRICAPRPFVLCVWRPPLRSQEDKRRSWRRPIKGILDKLREAQDDRRTRRNAKLEVEKGGVPGTDSSDGRMARQKKTSSSSGRDERDAGKVPTITAVFTSQIEATRGSGVDHEDEQAQGGREGEGAKAQRSRGGVRKARNKRERRGDSASEVKDGDEDKDAMTTKRKRRALKALWGRVIRKLRGGKGSSGGGDGRAEVEIQRLRMLKELKEKVEERYGRELWGRAKGVRHELDDGLLLR